MSASADREATVETGGVRPHRPLDRTSHITGLVVGVASFVIAILVTYEVFVRTAFGATTGWISDVAAYLMGVITFGGAAYALAEGGHVSVDVVLTRVRPGTRRVLETASDLIVVLVVALLTWLSALFWWDAWSSGEKSWGLFTVSLWIPYSFLALGMAWLLVVQLSIAARRWR